MGLFCGVGLCSDGSFVRDVEEQFGAGDLADEGPCEDGERGLA